MYLLALCKNMRNPFRWQNGGLHFARRGDISFMSKREKKEDKGRWE